MPIDQNEENNRRRNAELAEARRRDEEIARNQQNLRKDAQTLEEGTQRLNEKLYPPKNPRNHNTSQAPLKPTDPGLVAGVVAAAGVFWFALQTYDFAEWWYALFPAALAGLVAWKFWKIILGVALAAVAITFFYGVLQSTP